MIGIPGRTALVSVALGLCVCARAPSAFAQASTGNSAAAQTLFDEAKRLMQKGDAAAACPKFEESQRLEPGVGTKLNLANCYERVGRSASAWILYLEVESDTKRNGQTDRQTLAHNRAAELAPKLSRITIEVPAGSRADGLVIERDGTSVGAAQWGLSIPVDPGAHTIVARAPGKKDWSQVSVAADASTQTVTVPALENAPAATKPEVGATPSTSSAPEKPRSHTQRYASYVAFGVGGAGVIVGSIFGLTAISKNNQSKNSDCQGNDCLSGSPGAQARSDARSAGNISTIAFAVGAAGLGTGLVLLLTEPKQQEAAASASLGAFALPSGGAVSLRGAF